MAGVTLTNFIPKYIKQILADMPKKVITNDRWNELWNLNVVQGDYNAEMIEVLRVDYNITKATVENTLVPHANNTNNPHAVTKAQVGLGNADNTADIDKPISTATQTALNLKANKAEVYTKTELDPIIRSGDTKIKVEVFTINSTDNGDGTFTYTNGDGVQQFGARSAEGYQTFALAKGTYVQGENRVEAIINDALTRSVASGGLVEVDTNHVQLTTPQGIGAEITIKYFERLGLMGEHAVTHQAGGTDEIKGVVEVKAGNPATLYAGKVWIDTSV
jgi:hypothetical protein